MIADKYSVDVKPNGAVKVGEAVLISVTYEKGDYKRYNPVLELVRSPKEYPEKPREHGKPQPGENRGATFQFIAEDEGIYVLRLKPFADFPRGRLVEIHVISDNENDDIGDLVINLEKQEKVQ